MEEPKKKEDKDGAIRTRRKVEPYKPRKSPSLGKTILCIPDAHAHPNHNNRRFEWLGRMVRDIKPDVVWNAGDWWDFPSLCRYESGGSESHEGRRYVDDLQSGLDALDRFHHNLKGYVPERMFITLGNHERRIGRAIEDDPARFEGVISYDDLGLRERGWEVYLPDDHVVIEGVTFSHYYVETRRVGSKYPANTCLNLLHRSFVFGHDHRKSYLRDGPINVVGRGCYFDYHHDWLPVAAQQKWWKGVVVLTNVKRGEFEPKFYGIDEVEARYG